MTPRQRAVLYPLAMALTIFGLYYGGLRSMAISVSPGTAMPLSDPSNIDVDGHGLIYIGLMEYERVQVYDRRGHFIRGFQVGSAGGIFLVHAKPGNHVEVLTARAGHLLYDTAGRLLSSRPGDPAGSEFMGRAGDQLSARDVDGAVYSIETTLPFLYRVSRTDGHGKRDTIISMTLGQWLISPRPAFLCMALGLGAMSADLWPSLVVARRR